MLVATAHFTVPLRFTSIGHLVPQGGYVAMDAFFVLSGYLICGLLLEEHDRRGRFSLRNFWTRRVLRIVPAMVAMLAAFTAWSAITGTFPLADTLKQDAYILGGFSNWIRALGISPANQYPQMWSLAMEFQFYALWPLLLLAMLRARASARGMTVAIVAGAAACAVARALLWVGPESVNRTFYNTLSWTDAWLIGCLVAVLAWRGWTPGPRARRAIGALVAAGRSSPRSS